MGAATRTSRARSSGGLQPPETPVGAIKWPHLTLGIERTSDGDGTLATCLIFLAKGVATRDALR